MNVNGREYNLNRAIKVEIINGSTGMVVHEVEFNPIKNRDLCARIDVDITGWPKVTKTDSPSYSASVKIYNPDTFIINLVTQNIRFPNESEEIETDTVGYPIIAPQVIPEYIDANSVYLVDYTATAATNTQLKTEEALVSYYQSRPKVRVYAGYYDTDKSFTNYTHLFTGYLNGSSLYRREVDDILQLNCHDIDLSRIDGGTILTRLSKEDRRQIERNIVQRNEKRRKGRVTFDSSFKNYVAWFADERTQGGVTTTVFHPALDQLYKSSPNYQPDTSWITVWYVKSKQAVLKGLKNHEKYSSSSWRNRELEALLTSSRKQNQFSPNTEAFYTTGSNIREILNDLCSIVRVKFKNSNKSVPVAWDEIKDNVQNSTYIVYPVSTETGYIAPANCTYRIWNYQNLLESPSVDAAGRLTLKMMLRPEIRSGETIALMLSKELGGEEGLPDIASFNTSITYGSYKRILGSMATSANLTTTPSIQMSESQVVSSLNKKKEAAQHDGYLFNRGWYINHFEHKLSSHKNDWVTTVKTVPMYGGVNT